MVNEISQLTQIFAGLSPQMTGFDLRSVNVEFVVEKVALGQTLLQELKYLFVLLNDKDKIWAKLVTKG